MGRKNNDLTGDFFIVAMRPINAAMDIWGCKADNGWKKWIIEDGNCTYLDFFLMGTKSGTIVINENCRDFGKKYPMILNYLDAGKKEKIKLRKENPYESELYDYLDGVIESRRNKRLDEIAEQCTYVVADSLRKYGKGAE